MAASSFHMFTMLVPTTSELVASSSSIDDREVAIRGAAEPDRAEAELLEAGGEVRGGLDRGAPDPEPPQPVPQLRCHAALLRVANSLPDGSR